MKNTELIEALIRIRDSYNMSFEDRDAMADACNILTDICYGVEDEDVKKGA